MISDLEDALVFDGLIHDLEEKDDYLSQPLKLLLKRVLYAHAKVEWRLESEIIDYIQHMIVYTEYQLTGPVQYVEYSVGNILEKLDFRRKLDVALELEVISKSTFNKIEKLNALRNRFAHPRAKKLQVYALRDGYIEAMKIIEDALIAMRMLKYSQPIPKEEQKHK